MDIELGCFRVASNWESNGLVCRSQNHHVNSPCNGRNADPYESRCPSSAQQYDAFMCARGHTDRQHDQFLFRSEIKRVQSRPR